MLQRLFWLFQCSKNPLWATTVPAQHLNTMAAMVVHAFQVSLRDGATIMIHTVCPTDIEPTSRPNIFN